MPVQTKPTNTPTQTPAPAAAPKSAVAAKVSTVSSRDDKGRFVKNQTSAIPKLPDGPKLGSKHLGEKNDPAKAIAEMVQTQRKKLGLDDPLPPVTAPPVREQEAAPAPETPEVEAPATPEAPVTPPAPAKVKVGDKEFTPEELQKHLQELEELKKAATQSPAQPQPEQPISEEQPAPPAQPSPEEIAKRQQEFVNKTIESLDAPLTETELDTLLAGGQEALQLFTNLRKRDMATAIMQARMAVADGLNPIFDNIFKAVAPVVQQHEQLQRYSTEQAFVTKHKDFSPHLDRARQVAEELWKRYPQQVSKMTQDQFIDEVARQTDIILTNEYKRWYPNASTSWRDAVKAAAQTAATASASTPAPATPGQTPAAAPAAAPARKPVRPPAAAVPQGGSVTSPASWDSMVAASLRPR
jgi:hypothetical protein